jgi:uncharacterized protein YndB with AHSA1/START domain
MTIAALKYSSEFLNIPDGEVYMAIIEGTVEIKCPPEKVFGYVADAKSWPKWHSAMRKSEQTSPGKMGVGATCQGTNHVMGREMEWSSKIIEWEPIKTWRENITSGSTQIKEHVTFTPVAGGTKFNLVYDMKVGGFLKLLSPVVFRSMRAEMKGNLDTLKNILETTT